MKFEMAKTGNTQRRLSSLQKNILVVLAALDERGLGLVPTRDIERMIEEWGNRPVYGPNLRESCRRMEEAGWVRTLRSKNLQLAVEMTEAGRKIAEPLLSNERKADLARRRLSEVRVLPMRQLDEIEDRKVEINNIDYVACRGDFVIRVDGSTCLQLWRTDGRGTRLEGDVLEVATWYQICHDAGLSGHVQVNECQALALKHR